MRRSRGFTLIETLITTAILISGLVAVATMFSYSIGANYTSRQRTTAAMLAHEKLEQFKSTPLANPLWNAGGFEYVEVGGDRYKRVWQVGGTLPRSVTVIVYIDRAGVSRRQMELMRAATTVGGSF